MFRVYGASTSTTRRTCGKERRKRKGRWITRKKDEENYEFDINHGGMFEQWQSQWIRVLTDILTYHSLVAKFYVFMSQIEHCLKPSLYEEAYNKNERREAMQEEMKCIKEK